MSSEEELIRKINALLKKKYGGASMDAMRKLFDEYDKNSDGQIDKAELTALLAEAEVGSGLTRGMWVSGINEKLDTNRDAKISWDEFRRVIDKM